MPTQDKDTLKSYFNTGDRPTEQQFADLIDSSVSKVNNILPDVQGNVAITHIDTASTITGTITKDQVTGLQADFDSKLSTANVKTINNQTITNGPGNITIPSYKRDIALTPLQDYTLLGNGNVFAVPYDAFSLGANKTYFFRGKYILSNPNAVSRTIKLNFSPSALNITSIDYVAKIFHGTSSNAIFAFQNSVSINGDLGPATAATLSIIEFEGVLRCTTAGTLTPKIGFNALGTNIIKRGSFLEFTELGANDIVKVGDVI